MQRAIDLAKLGAGHVSPNPMVGCVIVHNNKIIGEGWHQQFGLAHAEVNAIKSVHDTSVLSQSTLYVTLEPCSHFGKTPPCANAIIAHQFKEVQVGITDPNPLVSGRGIKLLKDAGIKVEIGILQEACSELNKRFIKYIKQQKPYVILKWAQTIDGFIAPDINQIGTANFALQKQISTPLTQKLTHKWRTEEDAILVGTNTALIDNPQLTAQAWKGKNPMRVVLDLNNRLPKTLNLFNAETSTLVIKYDDVEANNQPILEYINIARNKDLPNQILEALYQKGLQSLIIEGGTQLLQTFIDSNCWDEAQVIIGKKEFIQGVRAPIINGNVIAETVLDTDLIRTILPA